MPSFEDMKKIYPSSPIGNQIKKMSNMVFDETFSNSTSYRKGMIYTSDLEEIEEIEFRFIKTKTFTFGGNQVEYWVQFKTGVNPEIDYDDPSNKIHRLGLYIDVLNDNTNQIEKWLIVGKDQSEFDRYNVLKCDWEFEWLDNNRQYHRCLGCIMEANSYNSGVTSDELTTVVDNIATFVFPTNNDTKSLDYNTRFMIADSTEHPKTYEVTKITDTSPFGITKGTFEQTLYNEHTDLCEEIDIGDGRGKIMHMICDWYTSTLPPIINEEENQSEWKLSDVNNKIYVHGQDQVIQAVCNKESEEICKWHLFIDNIEYDLYSEDVRNDLSNYFNININNDTNTFTISVINKVMLKYIIKIAIYDDEKTYFDFVEMEVVI